MDEYINRNTLLNKVIEEKHFVLKTEDLLNDEVAFTTVYGDFADVVYSIPVDEDVVKVVRCKNCKYCEIIYPIKYKNEEAQEVHYCRLEKGDKKPTDFCSYGIRKEGRNNG
jgi:hypothetical protein